MTTLGSRTCWSAIRRTTGGVKEYTIGLRRGKQMVCPYGTRRSQTNKGVHAGYTAGPTVNGSSAAWAAITSSSNAREAGLRPQSKHLGKMPHEVKFWKWVDQELKIVAYDSMIRTTAVGDEQGVHVGVPEPETMVCSDELTSPETTPMPGKSEDSALRALTGDGTGSGRVEGEDRATPHRKLKGEGAPSGITKRSAQKGALGEITYPSKTEEVSRSGP